jgi:hypothetical protein
MKTQLRGFELAAHSALTLFGLSGVLAIFLPVAFGKSPWNGFRDAWFIALPFFLPPVNAAASVRWIMTGSFSKLEYLSAYVVSMAVALLPFVESIGTLLSVKELLNEWPIALIWLLFPLAIFCFDVYYLLRHRKHRRREFSAVMVLQIAYLPTAGFCFLIVLTESGVIGAYCALVAMSAYIMQIILAMAKRNHERKMNRIITSGGKILIRTGN